MLGKFFSNSVGVCAHREFDNNEKAVYINISRINHSCAPNCSLSWKMEDIRRKEVRACRQIQKGEEIVTSYISSCHKGEALFREERREALEDWGFTCQCQVQDLLFAIFRSFYK